MPEEAGNQLPTYDGEEEDASEDDDVLSDDNGAMED